MLRRRGEALMLLDVVLFDGRRFGFALLRREILGVVQRLLLYGQSHAIDTETGRDIGEVKPEQIVMIRERVRRAGRKGRRPVYRDLWTVAGCIRPERLPDGEGTCMKFEYSLNYARLRAARRRGQVLAMRAADGCQLYTPAATTRRAA